MASVSLRTTPYTFSTSATFILLNARRDRVEGPRPLETWTLLPISEPYFEPPKKLEPEKLFDYTARSGVNRPIERATRGFFPVPGTRASLWRVIPGESWSPLYQGPGSGMPPTTKIATSCLLCRGGVNTKRCGQIKIKNVANSVSGVKVKKKWRSR